jgi:serine-type D-Ala-D-Ala carboxypeptidase (penicillin-binding protein 5/6)
MATYFLIRVKFASHVSRPCTLPAKTVYYSAMTRRILFLLFAMLVAALPVSAASKHHSASSSPTPSPTPDTDAPAVHAASVIVLDARTGEVIYEKNADDRRPCASTQKLLTGLIVADDGNLSAPVTADITDTWCEPVKLGLQPGQTYKRFDLLQVMLVHSMNDVARCLARDNAGSVEAFADKMNHKAAELGMANSHFVNPNGLPIPDQYTTARDMSKVAFAAYHNALLRSIVCLKEVDFQYADGHVRKFENTNHVLLSWPNCNGMKTGYTDAAGHCLISSATNGGKEVISVMLGDNGFIWKDSYAMLSWALTGVQPARLGTTN